MAFPNTARLLLATAISLPVAFAPASVTAAAALASPTATPRLPSNDINLRHTVVVDVAARAKDAVVYISTDLLIAQAVRPNGFFGGPSQIVYTPGNSLGTGFLIHEQGYIVTNNHVIERAQKIKVELQTGEKYEAEVIGSSPESDIAILKISGDHPFHTIALGDSSDLMIGEPVIAIGNPFNFSYSVSSGIISAIHREIRTDTGKAPLSELIQTDAAINPGSSGGPLLNAYGQAIGINNAIKADAQNIGFAIQVNRLRDLISTLMKPETARQLMIPVTFAERRKLSPPATVEATVDVVTPSGPVALETINGRRPRDLVDAYAMLLSSTPKSPVELVFGGQTTTLMPETIPQPDALAQAQKTLGITVEPNSHELAARYGLATPQGMVVTSVVARSVAGAGGIKPGDVLFQLGSQRALDYDRLAAAIKQLPISGRVQVGILRGREILYGYLNF